MRRLVVLSAVLLAGLACHAGPTATASIPHCPWAMGPAASGPRPKPVGVITIGAIGLRTNLYQGEMMNGMASGTDPGLTWGPAVYPKGEPFGGLNHHVLGIAGHRTTRLHPFCQLNLVGIGNYITVQNGNQLRVYRVFRVARWVDPNSGKYFLHPERFDKTRRLSSAKRAQYIVLGACTPPRTAIRRINVLGKLVAVKTIRGRR